MKRYIKENVQLGELELYRILTKLALVHNNSFSTLVLPQALDIDKKNGRLTMPHYANLGNNLSWHESDGGSLVSVGMATKIPMLLQDLTKAPITFFLEDRALQTIPKFTFDYDEAFHYFCRLAATFRDGGLISATEYEEIKNILIYRQKSQLILNNGDFYPRNLIELHDGKLVLIDWETWNEHSPFYIIDHIENVAAVMYVHMWGNPDWQVVYRKSLQEQLNIGDEAFKKGVVMKSLQLANLWFGRLGKRSLVDNQIKLLTVVCRQQSRKLAE